MTRKDTSMDEDMPIAPPANAFFNEPERIDDETSARETWQKIELKSIPTTATANVTTLSIVASMTEDDGDIAMIRVSLAEPGKDVDYEDFRKELGL